MSAFVCLSLPEEELLRVGVTGSVLCMTLERHGMKEKETTIKTGMSPDQGQYVKTRPQMLQIRQAEPLARYGQLSISCQTRGTADIEHEKGQATSWSLLKPVTSSCLFGAQML